MLAFKYLFHRMENIWIPLKWSKTIYYHNIISWSDMGQLRPESFSDHAFGSMSIGCEWENFCTRNESESGLFQLIWLGKKKNRSIRCSGAETEERWKFLSSKTKTCRKHKQNLECELFASGAASATQNSLSCSGSIPLEKAMTLFATATLWLVSSFHKGK